MTSSSDPRVYADFQNADSKGRLRLTCNGTRDDLSTQGIQLQEGQCLRLYCEELEADGKVEFSDDEKIWVARIDWKAVKGARPGFSDETYNT